MAQLHIGSRVKHVTSFAPCGTVTRMYFIKVLGKWVKVHNVKWDRIPKTGQPMTMKDESGFGTRKGYPAAELISIER